MSIFGHFSLQKAFYERLTGDISLMTLVSGVYDKVPESAAFPYIFIGDIATLDWSSKTTSGMECSASVMVFSREGGRQEATQIMEQVYLLLHDVDLTLEDHELVMIRFVSSAITQEQDGWTYRGTMRFKALIQRI